VVNMKQAPFEAHYESLSIGPGTDLWRMPRGSEFFVPNGLKARRCLSSRHTLIRKFTERRSPEEKTRR
jgi:hypothetical protein